MYLRLDLVELIERAENDVVLSEAYQRLLRQYLYFFTSKASKLSTSREQRRLLRSLTETFASVFVLVHQ